MLLDAGAALDATDQHGNSALHAAGRCGRAAAFELLLQRGGDAELRNERGRPAKLLLTRTLTRALTLTQPCPASSICLRLQFDETRRGDGLTYTLGELYYCRTPKLLEAGADNCALM